MAETVKGNKIVYLYRIFENRTSEAGDLFAFVTDNNRSVSKDADTTATKDGMIRTPGQAEVEITSTSLLKKGDTRIDAFEEAMLSDKLIECWEANLEEAGTGNNKFKGRYYQGYITSFEKSSTADDHVEIDIEFGANGVGAAGEVTVTAAQQEQAAYVFADSTLATQGG